MKYIVTTDEANTEEIFTFPDRIHHDIMAQAVGGLKNGGILPWRRIKRQPISAGFVDFGGKCMGFSESLGLKSRPQDTDLLNSQ